MSKLRESWNGTKYVRLNLTETLDLVKEKFELLHPTLQVVRIEGVLGERFSDSSFHDTATCLKGLDIIVKEKGT
jgi:hypothetical protein